MRQKRTRVKICGITSIEDAEAAIAAGVDALGFIHYRPSLRHISIDQIQKITKNLAPFVNIVVLLVDPDQQLFEDISNNTPVDCFQFHGNESPAWLERISKPYYKKISLDSIGFDQAAACYSVAKALLADTPTAEGNIPGGTGRTFDWSLTERTSSKPLILAGGINPVNIGLAIEQTRPYAVDINSGVEIEPGKKSAEKMQQLMEQIRQTDHKLDASSCS